MVANNPTPEEVPKGCAHKWVFAGVRKGTNRFGGYKPEDDKYTFYCEKCATVVLRYPEVERRYYHPSPERYPRGGEFPR